MKYIVYTTDGYTELPIGVEVENCQIVDFIEYTEESALEIRSRYAKQMGVSCDNLKVVPFVDDKTVKAIQDIVSYMWENDAKHYKDNLSVNVDTNDSDVIESEKQQNHIFTALKTIEKTFGQTSNTNTTF